MVKFLRRIGVNCLRHWFEIFTTSVLIILCVAIIWANFPIGQWLTGWDNLHPEFNFWLNIKRSFTAVWQENQGLGHLGGHGHAATLMHTLILAVLSLVVPSIVLRAVFTFLMLVSGTFGALYLAKIFFKESPVKPLAAFSVVAFYLLNLATLQNFYVPLESFIIFYGLLPWILGSLWQFLDTPTTRQAVLFAMLSLLMTPIGFIPPLFLAYGLTLAAIAIPYLLDQHSWQALRKILIVGVISFAVNAFWLLPSMYFTLTSADTYLNSTNNQLSTQDFNLQSYAYGDLSSVAILEGFVFDSVDTPVSNNQELTYILQPWIDHLEKPGIRSLGYFFFGIILLGIFSIILKPTAKRWSVLLILIVGLTALAQNTQPFTTLADFSKHLPVINQAFRASFTKFSVPTVLAYALLFGFGIELLMSKINRWRSIINLGAAGAITGLLVVFMLPLFTGHLIYAELKQDIPSDYFELFTFMEQQPKQARIANFPLQWNWGWSIYEWGYTGSGFLWYGIEQPILDRAFDAWSEYNESYYLQLSTALYKKNHQAFLETLEKYDITWLLVDESVILPGAGREVLSHEELKKIFKDSPDIQLIETFGNLTLYRVTSTPSEFLQTPANFTQASGDTIYTRQDVVYQHAPNYLENTNNPEHTFFPFSNISSTRNLTAISNQDDAFVLKDEINPGSYQLELPPLSETAAVPFTLFTERTNSELKITFESQMPHISIGNEVISTINSKVINVPLNIFGGSTRPYEEITLSIGDSTFRYSSSQKKQQVGTIILKPNEQFEISVFDNQTATFTDLTTDYQSQKVQKCWSRDGFEGEATKSTNDNSFTLQATDAQACLTKRLGMLAEGGPELATINIDYRSSLNGKADFCLTKEEGDQSWICQNENIYDQIAPSSEWQAVTQTTVLNEEDIYWLDLFGRSGDDEGETNSIEYKNIELSIQKPLINFKVTDDFWLVRDQTYRVQTTNNNQLVVNSPISLQYKWPKDSEFSEVRNCSAFNTGSVESEIENDALKLQAANNGIACSHVTFNEAPLNYPYLLQVNGEHQFGRGPKFYLNNKAIKRSDLEVLLPAQDFSTVHSVLPWKNNENQGYTVNFESKSFDKMGSSNSFEDIALSFYPHDWISQVRLSRENNSIASFKNSASMLEAPKYWGTSLHFGTIMTETEPAIITLSQSHDTGWLGISRASKSYWWNFEAYQLLPHYRFNGWANAWELSPCKNSESECSQEIIILYWPQLLSFAGMVMIPLIGVGMLVVLLKSKTKF